MVYLYCTLAGPLETAESGRNDRIIPGSLATLSPLLGPVIGPIVSGFVGEKAGWRAVFWVQFGFGAYVWTNYCIVQYQIARTSDCHDR